MLLNIVSKNGVSYSDYDIQRALDKTFGKGNLKVKLYIIFDYEINWKARIRNGISKIEDLKIKDFNGE
jgi:hypothetical protein